MTKAELDAALDAHFGGTGGQRWRLTQQPVSKRGVVDPFSEIVEFYDGTGFKITAGAVDTYEEERFVVARYISNDSWFIRTGQVGA